VLFISAELEEVLRLSHRIEVLRDRRLIGEVPWTGHRTPEQIMATIAGGATS
jgi:monosaccharide-transporting ATPase